MRSSSVTVFLDSVSFNEEEFMFKNPAEAALTILCRYAAPDFDDNDDNGTLVESSLLVPIKGRGTLGLGEYGFRTYNKIKADLSLSNPPKVSGFIIDWDVVF